MRDAPAPLVLIVEDNALNLELARDILEVEGYEVLAATDAAECLAILAQRRPALILMDVQLPGKDGLQLTREFRANPATRAVPIVAMTAHAMVEDAWRAAEAGCDGYLTKPIQTRTLAQQVSAFLTRPRAAQPDVPPAQESRSA
jgi:CheY-like chemotaxis protein